MSADPRDAFAALSGCISHNATWLIQDAAVLAQYGIGPDEQRRRLTNIRGWIKRIECAHLEAERALRAAQQPEHNAA